MQKFFTLLAAFMLFAGTAQAGNLTSATWVGSFQGTPFTLTTGGGGLTVSGTSTGSSASVTITAVAPLTTSLDTTGVVPVFISQTLGGSQTIAIGGGAAIANKGIAGKANIYIGVDNTGILLFTVALGAGVAGQFVTTALVPGFQFPVEVTVDFFAWTSGMTTVGGGSLFSTTVPGIPLPLPDFMTTGTNSLDLAGNGSITLVSPTVTRVCVGSGFSGFPCNGLQQASRTASNTTLQLNFTGGTVPEPGTLLLLGAGLLGLVAVGRRQQS